jgi:hypothetical protein
MNDETVLIGIASTLCTIEDYRGGKYLIARGLT